MILIMEVLLNGGVMRSTCDGASSNKRGNLDILINVRYGFRFTFSLAMR
jgi:hypothetical protein